MQTDLAANCFNLFQRALNCCWASDRSGNIDGEKDRVETAFAHSGNVDAAVGVAQAEIKFGIEQTLSGIVVCVHHDRVKVEVARLLRNRLRLWRNSEQWQNASKRDAE